MANGILTAVLSGSFLLGLTATSAMAQSKDLSFQINQSLLTYSSTASDTKVGGGASAKSTTSDIDTAPSDMEVVANFKGMHLRFHPTVSNSSVFFGYDAMPNLEAGLGLGMANSSTDKPKNEATNQTISLYANYLMPMEGYSLEFKPVIAMNTATTEDAVPTKTNTAGTSISLLASYARPIAGGFSYLASLGYAVNASEEKESKTKVASTTLMVIPFGARFEM